MPRPRRYAARPRIACPRLCSRCLPRLCLRRALACCPARVPTCPRRSCVLPRSQAKRKRLEGFLAERPTPDEIPAALAPPISFPPEQKARLDSFLAERPTPDQVQATLGSLGHIGLPPELFGVGDSPSPGPQ